MALEIEPFLLVVGLMIVGAFIGSLVFKRFRLPDTVFLIGLGVILGPVTGFVDVEVFRAIAPLVATVAIILILFEGGLKIHWDEIAHGAASGSVMAVLVFSSTALLSAGVVYFLADVPANLAILMGMALGGAGAVIVIPLLHQMGVSQRARTIVSIEAATSDVLVVVGVIGLSTALSLGRTDPGDFARNIIQTFSIGLALGIAGGVAWAYALKRFTERSYEYVLTISALFLLYALTELLHGSGALAVLAFGLVVGNSRKTQKVEQTLVSSRKKRGRTWRYAPVFGVELEHLHHELVFFVRAFFFVALGVVLKLDVLTNFRFLMVGLLLTLAVVAGRFWGVQLLYGGKKLPAWERASITLMFPLGLAAASLSIVPFERFGLAGTENFGSWAAIVIVLTNLLAAGLVWFLSSPRMRAKIDGAPTSDEMEEEEEERLDLGRSRGRPWSID
jgi:potassium/hydrogen antiporter